MKIDRTREKQMDLFLRISTYLHTVELPLLIPRYYVFRRLSSNVMIK